VPFGRPKLLSDILDPDGVRAGGETKPEHLKAKMQVMRRFRSDIILLNRIFFCLEIEQSIRENSYSKKEEHFGNEKGVVCGETYLPGSTRQTGKFLDVPLKDSKS
jgi:hypothetical protein